VHEKMSRSASRAANHRVCPPKGRLQNAFLPLSNKDEFVRIRVVGSVECPVDAGFSKLYTRSIIECEVEPRIVVSRISFRDFSGNIEANLCHTRSLSRSIHAIFHFCFVFNFIFKKIIVASHTTNNRRANNVCSLYHLLLFYVNNFQMK